MRKRTSIDDFEPINFAVLSSEGGRVYSDRDIEYILASCPPLPNGRVPVLLRLDRPELTGDPVFLPRRDALAEKLEYAAVDYLHAAEWSHAPRRAEVQARMKQIRRSSADLLKALGIDPNRGKGRKSIPSLLRSTLLIYGDAHGGNGYGRMNATVDGVLMIHAWAQHELSLNKKRIRMSCPPRSGPP
jgi:hypothetical protein